MALRYGSTGVLSVGGAATGDVASGASRSGGGGLRIHGAGYSIAETTWIFPCGYLSVVELRER